MEHQLEELYAEPSGGIDNFFLQKISPKIAKKDTDTKSATGSSITIFSYWR